MSIELPDEILEDPLYQKCVDLAGLICCIVNDLVGVGKDLINHEMKINLVLYHFLLVGESLEHSCQAIVDMHDKAVEDFDVCAAQFLRRVNSA
jgi:hypothetical protein